ncbi:MAG: EFR1 family ferrodoxin, partial [Clostridia bacterium]
MNILALYFSGTGNTKYVVTQFKKCLNTNFVMHSIEEEINFKDIDYDTILLAYPIYGSLIPKIMRNFLTDNGKYFSNKNLITVVTQGAFSGDGGALARRQLNDKSIKHIASAHINMPSNLEYGKISSVTPKAEVKQIIEKANQKIELVCNKITSGKAVRNGRGVFSRPSGFCQRVFFKPIEKKLVKTIKIEDTCIGCGKCVQNCPMKNLSLVENKAVASNNCTLCVRCVNMCPTKSIKIFTKDKVEKQYKCF